MLWPRPSPKVGFFERRKLTTQNPLGETERTDQAAMASSDSSHQHEFKDGKCFYVLLASYMVTFNRMFQTEYNKDDLK